MDSGLIVSGTSKGTAFIQKVLQSSGCAQIAVARSGSEARRLLIENEYDLVVINAPLGDEYGHELAMSVAGGAGRDVYKRQEIPLHLAGGFSYTDQA